MLARDLARRTIQVGPDRPGWTVTLLPGAPGWWTVTQHGRVLGRLHRRSPTAWAVMTGPYGRAVRVYRTRRAALRTLAGWEADHD